MKVCNGPWKRDSHKNDFLELAATFIDQDNEIEACRRYKIEVEQELKIQRGQVKMLLEYIQEIENAPIHE